MANLHLINELIEKKKIGKIDFCKEVGITDQSLRQIVARNSTKTETLEKIAQVLKVPVGYFFGEQPSILVSGGCNQVHNGQGDQLMLTPEQREIEHLQEIISEKDKIIEEKERLIQVLMNK